MKHDFHVRTEPHTVRVIGIGCECGKRFANRDEHRLHQEARQRRQNRPRPVASGDELPPGVGEAPRPSSGRTTAHVLGSLAMKFSDTCPGRTTVSLRHCPHLTETLTSNPPIPVYTCCWCGQKQQGKAEKYDQPHGRFV